MKILVACEESQAVTIELRKLGHEAYSCDLEPCSGGRTEWHIQADALELLKMQWDMILAFPPCTYLTAAGAVRLFNRDHTIKDIGRYRKGLEAADFFMAFLKADCPRIAVENPVPMKVFCLPSYATLRRLLTGCSCPSRRRRPTMDEYIKKETVISIFEAKSAMCGYSDTAALAAKVYYNAARMVEKLPAADLRPVVRGEWDARVMKDIGTYTVYWCSECSNFSYFEYDFCPSCGAEMKGDENHG